MKANETKLINRGTQANIGIDLFPILQFGKTNTPSTRTRFVLFENAF